MINLLLSLVAFYLVIVVLMYTLQRLLLYHPSRRIGPPDTYGLSGFSEDFINAPDGTPLQVWYRPAAQGFPTIAYFHGNADHIGNRSPILQALADKGFGVLGLSYRGYGKSGGSPDENGLYMDARTAIAYLNGKGIATENLILYGESLGTGVAVQMATEHPVAMLILQAPYISVEDRASELYRFIPVKRMIKDKFRSIDKIGRVRAPLLLFHGEQDAVIPPSHGRRLLAQANEPKQGHFLGQTHHNDFDSALISEHVLAFTRTHQLTR